MNLITSTPHKKPLSFLNLESSIQIKCIHYYNGALKRLPTHTEEVNQDLLGMGNGVVSKLLHTIQYIEKAKEFHRCLCCAILLILTGMTQQWESIFKSHNQKAFSYIALFNHLSLSSILLAMFQLLARMILGIPYIILPPISPLHILIWVLPFFRTVWSSEQFCEGKLDLPEFLSEFHSEQAWFCSSLHLPSSSDWFSQWEISDYSKCNWNEN